ncbi:MAG: DUF4331 family protein [Deltaproteobacteria bacterium]|nr:DUF4331 family protein [Deltaproteobacteria bacterium]
MKPIFKWAALVAASCAVTAVVHPRLARSADHLDSPAVKADPAGDINDLYSWMDGNNAVLAMTVYPAAPAGAKFSDKIQYVFHTSSTADFKVATTNETNIICTFDAQQKAQCWAGTDEYVTGDASQAAGITSKSGKFKVFAGLRADPFFFNLDGFKDTVATVEGAAPSLTFDNAGCPGLDSTTATALQNKLKQTDGGAPVDFFKNLNTLAIVVSIDKTLITKGGAIVGAWASTNKVQ